MRAKSVAQAIQPVFPHVVVSPFPYDWPGVGRVLEEQCECGHRKAKHFDIGPAYGAAHCTQGPADGKRGEKGPTGDGDCRCSRFTFARRVLAKGSRPR